MDNYNTESIHMSSASGENYVSEEIFNKKFDITNIKTFESKVGIED